MLGGNVDDYHCPCDPQRLVKSYYHFIVIFLKKELYKLNLLYTSIRCRFSLVINSV